MKQPTLEQARRICEELGSDAIVIVAIKDKKFEFAAYGANAEGSTRMKVLTTTFDAMKRAKHGAQ